MAPRVGGLLPENAGGASTLHLMLNVFGACAVTFMMVMYGLERRDRRLILAFALGCFLSSAYGFLAGTWPFGVVEAIWGFVAIHRYLADRPPTAAVESGS